MEDPAIVQSILTRAWNDFVVPNLLPMSIRNNAVLTVVLILIHASSSGAARQEVTKTDTNHFERGMSSYRKGDYSAAIQALKKFVETVSGTDPKVPEAIAALGMSYYLEGKFTDALPLLEQTSVRSPSNADVVYALGSCHLRMRNPDGARRAFARMFQTPPDSASASLLTAKFMMRAQMEELAQVELEKAREKDPKLPQLHYLLGELAIFRGDLDLGVVELKTEISLNPGFSMAYYRLGDAYTRKRMLEEAEAPLKKAIWLNPDFSSPYILLGKVYEQQDRYELAEGMLKKAISVDPNNAGTHYLLGTVYRKTGRSTEAREQFEIYTKLRK